MEKIRNLIKPYLAVVFGVLFLLANLNYLTGGRATVVTVGVFALIFAIYYIAYGLVAALFSNKIPANVKKPLDVVVICLYPLFEFIISLIMIIENANMIGPSGWIIIILTLISSIAFVVLYVMGNFVNGLKLDGIIYLLGFIFTVALVVSHIFYLDGTPIIIGDVAIVDIAIVAIYISMMFASFKKENKE